MIPNKLQYIFHWVCIEFSLNDLQRIQQIQWIMSKSGNRYIASASNIKCIFIITSG